MIGWTLLLLAGWPAATISGAVGFGGALLLLPVLVCVVGAKSAVPVLTVAQLLGNLSRAAFGRVEIRWRPVLLFSLGAIPACVFGSRLFAAMSSAWVARVIGLLLVVVVVIRHTRLGRGTIAEGFLPPAGFAVGLLSALAGSAGPLGAAVFLGLRLPATAYVASEAASAVLIHLTKSLSYGRYAAMTLADVGRGLALGGAMVLGSWTGRKLIERLGEERFGRLVEALLLASAFSLVFG